MVEQLTSMMSGVPDIVRVDVVSPIAIGNSVHSSIGGHSEGTGCANLCFSRIFFLKPQVNWNTVLLMVRDGHELP